MELSFGAELCLLLLGHRTRVFKVFCVAILWVVRDPAKQEKGESDEWQCL